MSNVYLTELTNQKKKLATTLNNKGVLASESEKFNTLVPKVNSIIELKGEEKTLDTISTYNDTPQSIVQLKYPESKNLFDKDNANILYGYVSDKIYLHNTTRTVWIPCLPNQTYTVSKMESARFVVGFTSEEPANGVTVNNVITYNTATKITNTSGENDKYLIVMVYNATYDTTVTADEILATLQIELGSTATPYEPVPHTNIDLQLSSKNLIPYPYSATTKTVNGVTFTDNGDGSITVNGTATANTVYELQTNNSMLLLPQGTYTLSGCPAGGSASTYFMVAVNGIGISYTKFIRDFGNGAAFSSDNEKWKISIRIMSGTTVNNLVFKPQFELGSIVTPYTPYISDLTSVNVRACGKNLFDKDIPFSSYKPQLGGYFSYSWFVGVGTTVTFSLREKPSLGPTGYMYVHPTSSPKADSKAKWLAHQTIDSLCNQTATVVSEDGYVTLMLTEEAYSNYVSQLQLELGSGNTEYSFYQGQTYTPTSDGKVTGISSIYPITNIFTDNAGALITVKGGAYKEILPSTDKNGITKIYQEVVGSDIDENIKPENIKKGITILGVTGTME